MDKRSQEFSTTLVALLKGFVVESTNTKIYQYILDNQLVIEDYVSRIGLSLMIQEEDRVAYLRQRVYENEEEFIPRIVSRHPLSYGASVLLVLLRKEVIEINQNESDSRVIISRDDIIDKIKPYIFSTNDEAKRDREIDRHIQTINDLGFIRLLKGSSTQYEVLPIIRGFVDAQLLEDVDKKLSEYLKYATQGDSVDEPI